MIWGFRVEQRSSEKNPTPSVVENKTETQATQKQTETVGSIVHKWFQSDSIVQEYVKYAYEIGWMDLVLLMECENGTRSPHKQSDVVKNWVREKSFWFCQTSQVYHPEIVNTDEFWNDWRWQINKCNELMKWWTAFYGRQRIIKWQRCSDYVKNRFILE